MSDLTEAMQAAVDSVDATRRRPPVRHAPGTGPHGHRTTTGVQLRDLHDLPPIVRHRGPTTVTEVVRAQYGALAAHVLTAAREALLMVVLFWVCAILLAFVEVEGTVHVPGVGDATVITVAVVAASVLRGVFAAARRSGQAIDESRTR